MNIIDTFIFIAIKNIRKSSKRPDALAIFKEITKFKAKNLTLKYVEDGIQTLIEDGKKD